MENQGHDHGGEFSIEGGFPSGNPFDFSLLSAGKGSASAEITGFSRYPKPPASAGGLFTMYNIIISQS